MATSSVLESILTRSNTTSPSSNTSPLLRHSSPPPPSVTISNAPEPSVMESSPLLQRCLTPQPQLQSSPSPVQSSHNTPTQLQTSSTPPTEEITVENDEDYIFGDDPMCQVMDLLNFTVVHKKPGECSAYFTSMPPGDLIPKSQYLHERKYMCDWVKKLKSELAVAQVDKLNLKLQSENTEKHNKKLIKYVSDMNCLYGDFMKRLVVLMTKMNGNSSDVLLNIGSFENGEEADKLLNTLDGLSNMFHNQFEALEKINEVLKQVNGYLEGKSKNVPTSSSRGGVERVDQPLAIETQLNINITSNESGLEIPTVIIPEDGEVLIQPCTQSTNISGENSTSSAGATTTFLESSTTQVTSAAPPIDATNSSTTPELSPTTSENSSSAFVPVPETGENGSTFYSLVEYPKMPTLKGKKHGFKKLGANGFYCECGQVFATVALLKYHIRYFNAKWKFLCKLCGRRYPGINFLKLHMLRTHQIAYNGMNACNYCTKSYQTASELLRHLKNEHKKQLPDDVDPDKTSRGPTTTLSSCTRCPGPSTRSSDPKSILVVNGSRCACGMELGSKEALIAHIRSEVELHGQSFQCSMCTDTFNHPCNLKSHFRERHGLDYQDFQDRQYGCSNCDEMFSSCEDLDAHNVYNHQMQVDEGEFSVETVQEKNLLGSGIENSINTYHFDTPNNIDDDDGAGISLPVDTEVPELITIYDE